MPGRPSAGCGPAPAVLVVPTVAAWRPGDGDPVLLAWRGPTGGLVAVAWSDPAALDRAMPGGQPWVAVRTSALRAALAGHGPFRLLVDPSPTELAATGTPPGRPADPGAG